jgi:hypothetical protein
VQRLNGSMAQWHNGIAAQRHNGIAAQRHNGTTAQGHNGSTVQRLNGTMAQWHNGTTAQGHNGSTVQRLNCVLPLRHCAIAPLRLYATSYTHSSLRISPVIPATISLTGTFLEAPAAADLTIWSNPPQHGTSIIITVIVLTIETSISAFSFST